MNWSAMNATATSTSPSAIVSLQQHYNNVDCRQNHVNALPSSQQLQQQQQQQQQSSFCNYNNRLSVITQSCENKPQQVNTNSIECDDVSKSSVSFNDVNKSGSGGDSDDETGSDAEGIWSADIEQSFLEALAIYPPCGRRKIILSDEGKMYGRNELIARYIKLRTGKTRTRKQVSSHIQVLARRKSKEIQSHIKDQTSRERVLQSLASMSSSQIVSATSMHHRHSHHSTSHNNNSNNHSSSGGSNKAAVRHHTPSGHHVESHHHRLHQQQHLPQQQQQPHANNTLQSRYNTGAERVGSTIEQYGVMQTTQIWNSEERLSNLKILHQYSNSQSENNSQQATSHRGTNVATSELSLADFTCFVALPHHSDKLTTRHNFIQLARCRNAGYVDQLLETINIQQIVDKFPDSSEGLKELYTRGPQDAFFLVKCWADLDTNFHQEPGAFYGVTYQFESKSNMALSISTKVCSFGKQVIEKIETECPSCCEYGQYIYCINRSPMCDYMVSFIDRIHRLPETYMINSVLENFTVLQTVRNHDTNELLLCIGYTFEVSPVGDTNSHSVTSSNIYRLTDS